MKNKRMPLTLLSLAVLAILIIGVAGCGSSSNNNYKNTGTVYGVKVTPLDGSTGISDAEDVYVSWPESGYPAPYSFTFKMEEENSRGGWTGVETQNLGSTVVSGMDTWWFRPVYYLSGYTWFRVTLTDDTGRKQVIMFRSQATSLPASVKAQSQKTDAKGAIEHVVQTGK